MDYKRLILERYTPSQSVLSLLNENKWSSWTNYLMDIVLNSGYGYYGKFLTYGDASKTDDISHCSVRGSYTDLVDYKEQQDLSYGIMCFFGSDDKPNVIDGIEIAGTLSETLGSVEYKGYYKNKMLLVYLSSKVDDVDNLICELFNVYVPLISKTTYNKDLMQSFIDVINTHTFDVNDYESFIKDNVLMRDVACFIDTVSEQHLKTINKEFNEKMDSYFYCKQILDKLEIYKRLLKEKMTDDKNFLTNYDCDALTDDKSQEFVDAIRKFKDISVAYVGRNNITIGVSTYLRTWSKSDLKLILKNSNSSIRGSIHDEFRDDDCGAVTLFTDIFFNKKYKIKMYQEIQIGIDSEWNIRSVQRLYSNLGMTNPHMHFYNCFRDAQENAIRCFEQQDFDTGLAQLLAATQSITVTDNVVMGRFIRDLLFTPNNMDCKWIVDKDGNEHSIRELLETEYGDVSTMPDFNELSEKDVTKETL